MDSRGSRIKELRLQLNMTQARLAKTLGVSTPTVSLWESNLTRPKDMARLAEVLRTNIGWLDDGVGNPDDRTGTVEAGGQSTVINIRPDISLVPILTSDVIPRWLGNNSDINVSDMKTATATHIPVGKRCFAVEVADQAMRTRFASGDLVLLDPDIAPLPGDIVGAMTLDGIYMLRVYRQRGFGSGGEFELAPLNDDYPVATSQHVDGGVAVMVEHRSYR